MGTVICVTSHKGGTGKTTTAINLAASIAICEKKTLVIDFDPQGGATTRMGINKKTLKFDIYHALFRKTNIKDCIIKSELSFLNIIPANFHLIYIEKLLDKKKNKENILRSLMRNFIYDYDYIIIDSPPALGFLPVCAMSAADWLLITIQPQYLLFEGVGRQLLMAADIKKKYNPKLKIAGVLFTMCKNHDDVYKDIEGEMFTVLKKYIIPTVIPYDEKLRNSYTFKKPIILYDIMSIGAKSYFMLSLEIISLCEKYEKNNS